MNPLQPPQAAIKRLSRPGVSAGTERLERSCFYPRERFTVEPANSIQLSVCEWITQSV